MTLKRMRRLTETALRDGGTELLRRTAEELTARPAISTKREHSRLIAYAGGSGAGS